MKSNISLAGALAVAAAIALAGCAAPASGTPTPTPTPSASQAAGPMELMIHIQDGKASSPQPVVSGSMVTVMNMDATPQRIISDDATSFSVSVPAGGTAAFAAPGKPGSYPFHGEPGGLTGVVTVTAAAPSAAATMVCAEEARQTVQEILALPALPATASRWDGSTYSCTYPLDGGDFVMSVTETASNAAAGKLARELAGKELATPIAGLANLGLPGYQSGDGHVIFAKDSMVLHVDASAFAKPVGPHQVTGSKFAYELATTILGCWTEHHS